MPQTNSYYPSDMSEEDRLEFEEFMNRRLDEERARDHAHDHLERDHDEPYEHEVDDNWYDEQYDLGDY